MPAEGSGLRVFVAGHRGMVGSALVRRLQQEPGVTLITCDRAQLDLSRQGEVERFFAEQPIDHVYLAAARVGGILANDTYPADFIRENLQIQTGVIHAASQAGVRRLLFLGSSCIYPRDASQPMAEEALLQGPLEPTNEAYAIAKIAGIKMCESYRRQFGNDFRSVMPTNLYGPNDNFDLGTSHVLPALLRKFHQARCEGQPRVVVWGSGSPRREFLHVDDMAEACYVVMNVDEQRYWSIAPVRNSHVNIGCGQEIPIADLARLVAEITGFTGEIVFDTTRPDGAPRKLLNVDRAARLGWRARIGLRAGIEQTWRWMVDNLRDT